MMERPVSVEVYPRMGSSFQKLKFNGNDTRGEVLVIKRVEGHSNEVARVWLEGSGFGSL